MQRTQRPWWPAAPRRHPGQVLVIFALSAIPLLAAVGLAIDGGNILAQRRAAQNGADAAALAGVRDIARGEVTTIDSDIVSYGKQNAGGSSTVSYTLIDNTGSAVGLSSAVGVRTNVSKSFPTYFINIIGFSTFTVSATATARVQRFAGGAGAPFIVCAGGLLKSETWLAGGILDYSTTPPSIRPQAIYNPATGGPEYYIHGSKVGQNDGDCGWEDPSSNWKGVADDDAYCAGVPCWFEYDGGTKAGPIRSRIAAYDGCSGNDSDDYAAGCVVVLPIAARKNTPGSTCTGSPSNSMCVVTWGAFQIRPGSNSESGLPSGCTNANCHIGRLLGQVLVAEGVGTDWTPGTIGPLVVRLTS